MKNISQHRIIAICQDALLLILPISADNALFMCQGHKKTSPHLRTSLTPTSQTLHPRDGSPLGHRRAWDHTAHSKKARSPKNPMWRWGGEGLRRLRGGESGLRSGLQRQESLKPCKKCIRINLTATCHQKMIWK